MDFYHLVSYAHVWLSVQTRRIFETAIFVSLVTLPESLLSKFQFIFLAMYFNRDLKIHSIKNTGRIFWYMYLNYEIEDGEIIINDFYKLHILWHMDSPQFRFTYKNHIIDNKLIDSGPKFNTLIIKNIIN